MKQIKQPRSRKKLLSHSAILALALSASQLAAKQNDSASALRNLVDFEKPGALQMFESPNVDAKIVKADDAFGSGKALAIKFSDTTRFSGIRLKPKTPWNWSELSEYNMAVDLKNTSDESVQVYLSLVDERGDELGDKVLGHRAATSNRSVNLAPGESGTYFVILDGAFVDTNAGIREQPKPWVTDDEMFYWRYGEQHVNLGNVTQLALFVRGTLSVKSIEVDNLRLRKNPEYDLSYLSGFVDEFGQNSRVDFPIKVHSQAELREAANKELAALATSGPMPDRSRFGGWKDGPKLEATGYFRTQKMGDQWWMVDPDGYLFFSHGVANVRMANLTTMTGVDFKDPSVRLIDPNEVTPEDSIGIVAVSDQARKSRYVSSDIRNNMFNWLPSYDDELAEHYSYRRKVLRGPVDSGETFSFYRANLERRYGQTSPESYIKKWEEVTLDRMLDWGFTSMGNWVDPAFYPNEKVPYFANGWIIGDFKTLASKHDVWSPMPDPYDPEFAKRAELTVDIIAKEIKGSPWCVGIFVDNEKSWGFRKGSNEQRFGIILDALSKEAAQSPAKHAFTVHLEDKYQDIKKLNTAWGSSFNAWSDLAKGFAFDSEREAYVSDLSDMLEMLSEKYFIVVHGAVEKALPNHLYMGARMANFGMPDETIKAAVKYSDVLSFNIYEEGVQDHDWAFLKDIDLPSVIGEFHIGATNETGLFHPGLVQADDQKDRAQMYLKYMQSVADHKNMVGAHWFQYIDSPITGRAIDGEPYNVGFVSNTDIPYDDMVNAAKKFNSALYANRFKQAIMPATEKTK